PDCPATLLLSLPTRRSSDLAEVVEELRDVIEQDRALEALGRLETADARLPIRDDLSLALADEVRQPPRLLSLALLAHAGPPRKRDRKSTRLNSSHGSISYAV